MGTCKKCKYFYTEDDEAMKDDKFITNTPNGETTIITATGYCRRYPPSFSNRATSINDKDITVFNTAPEYWTRGWWPQVESDEWCGEFQSRNEINNIDLRTAADFSEQECELTNDQKAAFQFLPIRLRNSLRQVGTDTMQKLLGYTADDILDLKNVGEVTLAELQEVLSSKGLSLRE